MENQAKEIRKQKRLEKLGTNNPVCIDCGNNDWRCLELHHIAGKDYADDMAILCRNCHRKLSDDQKGHPKKIGPRPSSLESIGHVLLGLADLFAVLVERFREYGQLLIKTAQEMAQG